MKKERLTKKEIYKYIDNIEPTDDCCGKWDIDSEMISISTRCWRDNTAKCSFVFDIQGEWKMILESNYLKADTKLELERKCKEWYKRNIFKACAKLLALTREELKNE